MNTVPRKVEGAGLAAEWMDLRTLQHYATVSERTLRDWIRRPENPLPAVRVGTKILVKRSRFDQWLESHPIRLAEAVDIDAIVNEVVTGISEGR